MSTQQLTQPDAAHATQSQFQLLKEKRFLPFFLVQFLGAGNDNIFKFAFTVLATYSAAEWGGLDSKIAGAVIGGIFILPFVLFSATAGQIADKYDKDRLIRFVKSMEIGIALVIAAGFIWKIPACLFAGVFLMGLHSTLFGPVKFSYLPQHLRDDELTGGNGLLEMGTFVAILLGTMLGGVLVAMPEVGPHYVAWVTIAVAVLGRLFASWVPASPAADPSLNINWNPLTETLANLRYAKANRTVFLSMLGISWLWFFGSIFLTSFTGFAKDVLGGNEQVVTLLLATFSVGIGIGSLLCEKLSGHKVEIGLVPFGSIGMTVFAVDLYFASRGMTPNGLVGAADFMFHSANIRAHWRVAADLFLLAMFAGFYSVPLYALIQSRTEKSHVARVIAANNILNALFMVVASLMAAVLLSSAVGLSLPQLFLVTALLNAAVAIYIYGLVPEFLMRFLCWMLIHTVYRVRKKGLENIPDEGAAVIVCNHVSFVDALVITAACPRPIRFVMDHQIFKIPVLSFIFRTGKAIPIASAKVDEALLNRAYDSVAEALEQGELVCIFPEGRITDTGDMYPFKGGIKRIIDRTPVPVIPMALSGLWGSFFSRKGGPAMTKPFRRGVLSRITLSIAPQVGPALATPEALQTQVLALRGDER
ncbi:MAG: MFS transporter [Burkholderiales bacterium]|nr:MFS transporter [Burkholderiales bacterium]